MTIESKIMEYVEFVRGTTKAFNKPDFTVSRLGVVDILSQDADVKRMNYTADDINDSLRGLVVQGKLKVVGDRILLRDPFGNQLYTIDNTGTAQLYFDNKGLELRDELIRRFGAEKCYIVTYQGCKDANELLQDKGYVALRDAIKNARELPIESLVDLNNQYDSIYNYYQNGLPKGYGIGINEFDNLCRWDVGMIVPVTGVPSHGKSEMLDFIVSRLNITNGWKVAFYSPENNPVTIHYSKIATKIAGSFMREYKTSKEVFDETFEYIEQNFFWIDPDQNAVASTLLNQVEQLIKRKGIKVLVLDPFNCIDLEQGKNNKSETETQAIGRFLYELQRFARRNKVLIFIVAHPAKPMQPQKTKDSDEKKYPIMTLYDIAGSAHWYNRADIGIVVHRDFATGSTTLIFQKVRFSNLGHTGQLQLQYNMNNGRFNLPFSPDNKNWLITEPEIDLETAIKQMEQDDKFDCPF